MSRNVVVAVAAALGISVASIGVASAATPTEKQTNWSQGFEKNDLGWHEGGGYGYLDRVNTSTDSVSSADGNWHARVLPASATDATGPYARFAPPNKTTKTWPGPSTTEIDVYLDPTWATGDGFDYSVAMSREDDTHLRDFIFHVGVVDDELLVNANNNTDFTVNPANLLGGQQIAEAGWYTLQHVFTIEGDLLKVTMNVLDADGDIVFTADRSNPAGDPAAQVGGQRYGWFTAASVEGGLAIDNQELILGTPSAA